MKVIIVFFTIILNYKLAYIENNDTKREVILQSDKTSDSKVLTQEMFKENNTRYIIKENYDLLGESIKIPSNCTLCFDGGSIKNGNFIKSDFTIENIDQNTIADNDLIKLYGASNSILELKKDIFLTENITEFPNITGNGHTIKTTHNIIIENKDKVILKDLIFTTLNYGDKFKEAWGGLLTIKNSKHIAISNIVFDTNINTETLRKEQKRGNSGIRLDNCQYIDIKDINFYNIAFCIGYNKCSKLTIENVNATNSETVISLKNCQKCIISNISLNNEKEDINWICGGLSGVGLNGKNTILITGGYISSDVKLKNIYSKWPIERSMYLICKNLDIENITTINGCGIKLGGEEEDIKSNIVIKNIVNIHYDKNLFFEKEWNKNIKGEITRTANHLDILLLTNVKDVKVNNIYIESNLSTKISEWDDIWNHYAIFLKEECYDLIFNNITIKDLNIYNFGLFGILSNTILNSVKIENINIYDCGNSPNRPNASRQFFVNNLSDDNCDNNSFVFNNVNVYNMNSHKRFPLCEEVSINFNNINFYLGNNNITFNFHKGKYNSASIWFQNNILIDSLQLKNCFTKTLIKTPENSIRI